MTAAIRCLTLLAALAGCADGLPPPAQPRIPAAVLSPPSTGELEIRFLDVGQGDAVLLREGGIAVLVDAGPADRVAARLRELGVDSIGLLVASHNHADHMGGMDAVLDSFPVGAYLDNGRPAGTRIQDRILERVEAEGSAYLRPTERTISLGATRIRVVPAPAGVEGDEQNNRSLTLLVERGAFRALLTGDSEVELLNALLDAGAVADVDVLKAAHHGSRNGVTPRWLAETRPEVVVISAGGDNAYGHPHGAALRYYCAGDREVYRTDRSGEVVVSVDASGAYSVEAGSRGAEDACAGVAGAPR